MIFLEPESYQPGAQDLYDELAARLEEAMPTSKIEHVGSSAIDGAISKGDLDIYVGVEQQDFESAIDTIQSLGFLIKEDSLRNEHLCPFWSDKYNIDVGVQLVVEGSKYASFREFRDVLKSDQSLLQSYNLLKRECAGMQPADYRRRKSKFIESVLNRSR